MAADQTQSGVARTPAQPALRMPAPAGPGHRFRWIRLHVAGGGRSRLASPGGTEPEAAPARRRQPIASGGPPMAFDAAQFALLTELVDLLLPRTDTPGALDVGAHWYVDQMAAARPALGRRLRAGLDGWAGWVLRHGGAPWRLLPPRDQLGLLAQAADGAAAPGAPHAAAATTLAPALTGAAEAGPGENWARELKTLVIAAYFQSEMGREEQLHFVGGKKLAVMPGCPEGVPTPEGRR